MFLLLEFGVDSVVRSAVGFGRGIQSNSNCVDKCVSAFR
ncbi:hypothetical protein N806_25635 [Rhodococcus sp. P27]|nr:hypothetical protein N806_25635 [Rhodococcus sp. P27]